MTDGDQRQVPSFGPAGLLQEIELGYGQSAPHASDATLTLVSEDGEVVQVVLTAETLAHLEVFLKAVRETFPEVLDLAPEKPESDG